MKIRTRQSRLVVNKAGRVRKAGKRSAARNPLRTDPTRTALLRKKFSSEVGRGFARLKAAVVRLVQDEDAFGLKVSSGSFADLMKEPKQQELIIANAFCPTGEGGGVDPTCSPKGGKAARSGALRTPEGDAAAAMAALHPFPEGTPPTLPPGSGRPDLVAKDPGLQAAVARHREHVAAYHRAAIAAAADRLLNGPEPRPARTAKQAVDQVQALLSDRTILGPAFASHQAAVVASHPLGETVLDVAMAVVSQRLPRAYAHAEGLIAQLPDRLRERAQKLLSRLQVEIEGEGTANAFCPTGKGGGIDPTCSPGGSAVATVISPLTEDEEDAIAYYRDTDHEAVNDVLRGTKHRPSSSRGAPPDKEFLLGTVVSALDSAIAKHVLDKDVIVYRGTRSGSREGPDPGYTSVTTDRKVAEYHAAKQGGTVAQLKLPKGTHALPILGGESELLLPRGYVAGHWTPLANAFCPTGKGGGVDPTCSPGGVGKSSLPPPGPEREAQREAYTERVEKQRAKEDAELAATRAAEDKRRQKELDRVEEERDALEDERTALDDRWDAENERIDLAREREDETLQKTRQREDDDWERRHDEAESDQERDALAREADVQKAAREAEDLALQRRRRQEDDNLQEIRDREDEELYDREEAVRETLERLDREDAALDEAREREDDSIAARRGYQDRALWEQWDREDEALADNAWTPLTTVANTRWQFHSTPEKVRAFTAWLRTQVGQTLRGQTERELWQRYIAEGFRRGAGRAFDDTRRAQRALAQQPEQLAFYAGTKDQFLRSAFAQPVAVETVQLLAGRAFADLEGVTEAMSTAMVRVLTDGLVRGASPHEVARDLTQQVDGIGRARAEMIARTETIRAHSEGQLTALEQLGVEEVGVSVEWTVTPDARLCPKCASMKGVVLKISEARGMIPRHPNCRCAWVPSGVGESTAGQKRSKRSIESAAVRAGLDVKVSAARPQSVLNTTPELLEFSRLLANAFCPTGKGGGVDPSCSPGSGQAVASKTEWDRSLTLARAKIAKAPVPTEDAVLKSKVEMEKARVGAGRAGGESRGGNAADRRRQRQNLFKEFGGPEKGYVVCPWTGIKMHWTDDPGENPNGFPLFERGKIFTKCQGGGYQLPNLIPESFTANRSRNDKRLRQENASAC